MAERWLMKTEPSEYSYNDLEKEKKTSWTGVSNPLALKHLRSMKKGDFAFIYHTGDEKAVVGIAAIASDPYSDPKSKNPKLVVVDIVPRGRLVRPVTLAEIKAVKLFAEFELVRMPRLSVMPVPERLWQAIERMGT